MKKLLVLGMIVVMAMAVMAGCGDDGQVPGTADPQVQEQQQSQAQTEDQNVQEQQGTVVDDGVVMDPSKADLIGEDKAKQIALDRVDGAAADNIRAFDLDYDDGRWKYEGEIHLGDWEYEFEINAETGDVISWEKDHIYD